MTSYAKRQELKKHSDAVKELEREMKEEAEAERKVCRSYSFSLLICLGALILFVALSGLHLWPACLHNNDIISNNTSLPKTVSLTDKPIQARIQRIKDRREAKEEKLRYEKMAEKMHHKRLDRLKRREKRNKLLSS